MSDRIVKKVEKELPLVSVVVITYNSKDYVLETLESIKNQSYGNIELIISDDCSTDDTVEICQNWLESNADSFIRADIVTAPSNKGIPGNCNQGLNNANGEWVKFIAGDDILLPDCIDIFCEAALSHPHVKCFLSQQYVFHGTVADQIVKPTDFFLPPNASKQLISLIKYGSLPSPAAFFSKNVLLAVGGFDERYRGVEDYPIYIRLTKSGYFFHVIQKPTLIYRHHQKSVTKSEDSPFLSSYRKHFDDVIRPLIKEKKLYSLVWHYYLQHKLIKSHGVRKKIVSWTTRLTDFVYWRIKLFHKLGIMDQHTITRTVKIESLTMNELINPNLTVEGYEV